MSIRTITLAAFDTSGSPLAGLSPTWSAYRNATTGGSLSAPTVTALSGGLYKTSVSDDACGFVDFGATASPRYVFVSSVNVATFAAFTSAGVPLAGLTPTWSTCLNGLTGASTVAPAIIELGDGCYSAPSMSPTTCGVVSLGGAASPANVVLSISDGQDSVGPTAGNFSPATGTTINPQTPITFDVAGANKPLALVVLVARFGATASELVYDGEGFAPLYAAQSVVQSITNGLRFTLVRAGGWPASGNPTIWPFVVDAAGNVL